MDFPGNVDFEYCPPVADAHSLAVSANDWVLTTSWWTTEAALESFDPSRIIYVVTEDERRFYRNEQPKLLIRGLLGDQRLRFAINTSALMNHLVSEGMVGVATRGVSFEPAFPLSIYSSGARRREGASRFLLYAEPGTPPRLKSRAIDAIFQAIRRETTFFSNWEFLFVGSDLPSITLPAGAGMTVVDRLTLQEFGALLGTLDMALIVANPDFTLYPVSPACDLKAGGAIIVANCDPKRSLPATCGEVLCCGPSLDEIEPTLDQAVRLWKAAAKYSRSTDLEPIARDWEVALAPVVECLLAR